MRNQSLIRFRSETKRPNIAPEIHKIHKPEPPSAPTCATPRASSLPPARALSAPLSPVLGGEGPGEGASVRPTDRRPSSYPHSPLIAQWFGLNHSHQKKPSILPKTKLPQPKK